jgi:tetratricopeptide (TPR) repeat protein
MKLGLHTGIVAGCVLQVMLARHPASAAPDKVTVAVFAVSEERISPRQRTSVIDSTGQSLRRDRRLVVVDIDRELAARARQIPAENISEARGLLNSGEALLRKGRAKDALVRLETAASHLEKSLSFVSKDELARAQFLVGAAYAVTGKKAAARTAFIKLQTWRPQFVADISLAPAQVLPIWEVAKTRVGSLAGGSIELATNPRGALAYVDGNLVGITPTTVEGLVLGRHYITFKLAGYQRLVSELEVSSSQQNRLDVELDPSTGHGDLQALLKVIKPTLGAPVAAAELTTLGKRIGADHLLFIEMSGAASERYQAFLYDSKSRRRLAAARHKADTSEPDELFAALVSSIYADLIIFPQPEPRRRKPSTSKPFYSRWWFWTGVAALATAAAVPLIMSVDGGHSASCPPGHTCGNVILEF